MTKKIFAMFLAVLMVISLLPTSVFAADEKTCPGEGKVHTKANCSYTQVGEPVAPTCGSQGYTNYKCNECGANFIADIVAAAGEHTWVNAPDVAPTCEKDGSTGGKQCSVCKLIVDATVVAKLGADGVKCEWELQNPEVSCLTGGKELWKCKHCGATKEGKEIPKKDAHNFGEWEVKTAATADSKGLAVRKCQNCAATEEIEIFYAHDHVLFDVAEVAPGCETAGVKAHKECRICGAKFVTEKGELVQKTDADLVIKSKHDQLREGADCLHLTAVCDKENDGCGKIIEFGELAKHDMELVPGECKAATCTMAGYNVYVCKTCKIEKKTEAIKPLGHIIASNTIDATCVKYGYTFTYCLRDGCTGVSDKTMKEVEVNGVVYDLTAGATDFKEPVIGAPFYLKATRNDETFYAVAGNANTEYITATKDPAAATKFYLEAATVEGVEVAYRMYYIDSVNQKQYVTVAPAKDSNNIITFWYSTETPKDYITWNAENGLLMFNNLELERVYFVGMNKKGENFAGIRDNKIGDIEKGNRFPASMYATTADGVALISITVDKTAGYNKENHNWVSVAKTPATCLADGVEVFVCGDNCGVQSKQVVLTKLADHAWKKDEAKSTEATCTAPGKNYYYCDCTTECNATKEEVVPVKGHTAIYNSTEDKTAKVFTSNGDHNNTLVYDYNECYVCHAQFNKHNYRTWVGVGKIWDTLEEANEAHGAAWTENDGVLGNAGSCTTVGYNVYTCTCGEKVRVKIAGTGKHADGPEGWKVDAECDKAGYYINYKCSECGKLYNESKKENEKVEIPAKGHDWKELTKEQRKALGLSETYTAAPCDQPNYENWTHKCDVCGEYKNDGTKKLNTYTVLTDAQLCTTTTYEWYTCHCGKNHMRNAVGNFDHNWVNVTDKTLVESEEGYEAEYGLTKPATCTKPGYIWKYCTHCGKFEKVALAIIPHENKDGVKFTDACTDTTADRHCVKCCACKNLKDHDCVNNKDSEGNATPCACVIKNNKHTWDRENTFVESVCGSDPYSMRVCTACGKREVTTYSKYFKGTDEKGNKIYAEITGLGHNPKAWDGSEKYAGYAYKTWTKYNYVLENGELVQKTVTYTGIFTEYVEPTHTTAGKAVFVCADCGETITTELAPLAGLAFELDIVNGTDGGKEFTYGSLIEVTVTANSFSTGLYNFKYSFAFNNDNVKYVGYELINNNFNFIVKDPSKTTDGTVLISGYAVNTADGKKQDIMITENTGLIKLLFYVINEDLAQTLPGDAAKQTTFTFVGGEATNSKAENVENTSFNAKTITIDTFMDFDGDGFFSMADLTYGVEMLTGENIEGKVYDVTLDVNKDGEFTLEDLSLAYNYLVGNYSAKEMLLMGVSENTAKVLFPEDYCVKCGEKLVNGKCENCK